MPERKKLTDYERAKLYHDAMTASFQLAADSTRFLQEIVDAKVLPPEWERRAIKVGVDGTVRASGIAKALGLLESEER